MAGRMLTSEERRRERKWKRIREGVGRFFRRVAMGAALALASPMASSAQPPRSAQPSQNAVQTQESRGQNRSGEGADGEYSVRIYTPEENVRRLMERGLIREARQDRVLFARLYGIGGEELVRQLSRDMFLRGLAAYGRFRGAVVMGEEDLKAMLEWMGRNIGTERASSITIPTPEQPFYVERGAINLARVMCGSREAINCFYNLDHYPGYNELAHYHNACISAIRTFQCSEPQMQVELFYRIDRRVWRRDAARQNAEKIAQWLKERIVKKMSEGEIGGMELPITGIENNDIIVGGHWVYVLDGRTLLPQLEAREGEEVKLFMVERSRGQEGAVVRGVAERMFEIDSSTIGGRTAFMTEWEWKITRAGIKREERVFYTSEYFTSTHRNPPYTNLIKLNSFLPPSSTHLLYIDPLTHLMGRLAQNGRITSIRGRVLRVNYLQNRIRRARGGEYVLLPPIYPENKKVIYELMLSRERETSRQLIERISSPLQTTTTLSRVNEILLYAQPHQINGLPPTYAIVPEVTTLEVNAGPLRVVSRRLIEKRDMGLFVLIDGVFTHPEVANKWANRILDGGGPWRSNSEIGKLEIPQLAYAQIRGFVRVEEVRPAQLIIKEIIHDYEWKYDLPISGAFINRVYLKKENPFTPLLANTAIIIKDNQALEIFTYGGAPLYLELIQPGGHVIPISKISFTEPMEFATRKYGEVDWKNPFFIGWIPSIIIFEPWLGRIRSIPKGIVLIIIPKKNGRPIMERFGNEERMFGIMVEISFSLKMGRRTVWEDGGKREVVARPAYVKVTERTNRLEIEREYLNLPPTMRRVPSNVVYNAQINDPQIIRMLRMREDYLREVRRLRERQRVARR